MLHDLFTLGNSLLKLFVFKILNHLVRHGIGDSGLYISMGYVALEVLYD